MKGVRMNPDALAECRLGLAMVLKEITLRIRGMYPTRESVAVCKEAEEAIDVFARAKKPKATAHE